jgi:hypothetical protein
MRADVAVSGAESKSKVGRTPSHLPMMSFEEVSEVSYESPASTPHACCCSA